MQYTYTRLTAYEYEYGKVQLIEMLSICANEFNAIQKEKRAIQKKGSPSNDRKWHAAMQYMRRTNYVLRQAMAQLKHVAPPALGHAPPGYAAATECR
jgi:hypothetical protein